MYTPHTTKGRHRPKL